MGDPFGVVKSVSSGCGRRSASNPILTELSARGRGDPTAPGCRAGAPARAVAPFPPEVEARPRPLFSPGLARRGRPFFRQRIRWAGYRPRPGEDGPALTVLSGRRPGPRSSVGSRWCTGGASRATKHPPDEPSAGGVAGATSEMGSRCQLRSWDGQLGRRPGGPAHRTLWVTRVCPSAQPQPGAAAPWPVTFSARTRHPARCWEAPPRPTYHRWHPGHPGTGGVGGRPGWRKGIEKDGRSRAGPPADPDGPGHRGLGRRPCRLDHRRRTGPLVSADRAAQRRCQHGPGPRGRGGAP